MCVCVTRFASSQHLLCLLQKLQVGPTWKTESSLQKLQTDNADTQQGTSTLMKQYLHSDDTLHWCDCTAVMQVFTNKGRREDDVDDGVSSVPQGPSCWDDVLLQSRVHGVCHSDGCRGNEAVSGWSYKCVTAKM